MLPEFADGGTLPAAPWLGAAFDGGNQMGKMKAHVSGDGGAGAGKIEFASQFIGQQEEIKGLAVGQAGGQEIMGGLGPGGFVVATGGHWCKSGPVTEPLMSQPIELGRADMQALRRRQGVESAVIEGGQDFLNEDGRDAMNELFFMADENRVKPPSPESFSHWTFVEQ